jgi:hypothetical protein
MHPMAFPRQAVVWTIAYGPAAAWIVCVVLRWGPQLGPLRALAVGVFSGLGILGLSAMLLAWLPFLVERLGLRRAGAFLRRWWDEDAR